MNMAAITKVTVTAGSNSLADLSVTVDPQLRRIALLRFYATDVLLTVLQFV
jgi:hypothetical protein